MLNESNGQAFWPEYDVNTILVKYTLNGDMDCNGVVNTLDYARIDQGFLSQGSAEPLKGWQNGDVDYSGVVNTLDYAMIDSAFLGQQAGGTTQMVGQAPPYAMIAAGEMVGQATAYAMARLPDPVTGAPGRGSEVAAVSKVSAPAKERPSGKVLKMTLKKGRKIWR